MFIYDRRQTFLLAFDLSIAEGVHIRSDRTRGASGLSKRFRHWLTTLERDDGGRLSFEMGFQQRVRGLGHRPSLAADGQVRGSEGNDPAEIDSALTMPRRG